MEEHEKKRFRIYDWGFVGWQRIMGNWRLFYALQLGYCAAGLQKDVAQSGGAENLQNRVGSFASEPKVFWLLFEFIKTASGYKKIRMTLPLAALVFAVVAAFAYKPVPAAHPAAVAEKWFAYIGDPDDPAEQTKASNYELYNGNGSTPTCNSTADLCTVQLQTDTTGQHPLSSDVANISDDPQRRFNP